MHEGEYNMEKLVELLKNEYPSDALEIQECIDLLIQCICGCSAIIKKSIDIAYENKDYAKMKELPEYLETIEAVINKLETYSDALQIDDEIEQEIIEDDEYDSKDLPAYSELLVDSNIPHSLYDDYTYKRPAGFEFLGRKYSAKDWKDILVQTCERLAEKDIVLFLFLLLWMIK